MHICTCVVGLYSPCIHHMSTSQWQCSQALFFAAFLLLCTTLNANQRTKWGRPGNEAISDPPLTLFPIKAPPSYMHTYHWSLRMSRQMAPVTELMFGCHILVTNFTCRWEDVTQNLHHCKSVWWHLASFPGLKRLIFGPGNEARWHHVLLATVPCLCDSNTYILHQFISRETCLTRCSHTYGLVYNTLQQCTKFALSDEFKCMASQRG